MEGLDEKELKSYRDGLQIYASRGQLFFRLSDVLEEFLRYGNEEARQNLFEFICTQPQFGNYIANVLHGWSDHEWDSWCGRDYKGSTHSADSLREALMPYADDAAKKLLEHTIGYAKGLLAVIKEKDAYIKLLQDSWPETHKQYAPQQNIYCHSKWVNNEEVVELLEHIKGQSKE